MKKIVLILFLCIYFQKTEAQKPTFGVKGGVNFSNLRGSNELIDFLDDAGLGHKIRVGYHFGGYVKIELSERFFLQPELLFSLQGSTQKINDVSLQDELGNVISNTIDVRINNNLSYLNVPIMAKYYLNDEISVEAGPQIGYMLSGKFHNKIIDDGGLSDEIIESFGGEGKVDIENKKELDLGLCVGLGYDFRKNFNLGLRYNYGFTKVFEGSPLKNHTMQLSLGYSFE